MNIRIINIYFIATTFFLMGCSTFSDYFDNILSDEREDLIVYKTDKQYEDTQFDLIIPPDLITPNSTNVLEIPDYIGDDGVEIFTVDTALENIQIMRSGRDSFLRVKSKDKKIVWNKLSDFWRSEGFRLTQQDYTLGLMKTGFLENLSEAQLGTVQRYVGRYIPLLVSPETRDSYSTRLIMNDQDINILITHYGKEFMSDGDTEFRWQNRPRDSEFESEMVARLFIYLGGEEAQAKGYTVVKSTGVRNKANMNIDENGLHTLFINDIYERVWPEVMMSLETYGITIISADKADGIINVAVSEQEPTNKSFLSTLAFWRSQENVDSFNIVLISNQDGTLIEIQNDAYLNFTNTATEEVIRALYSSLR